MAFARLWPAMSVFTILLAILFEQAMLQEQQYQDGVDQADLIKQTWKPHSSDNQSTVKFDKSFTDSIGNGSNETSATSDLPLDLAVDTEENDEVQANFVQFDEEYNFYEMAEFTRKLKADGNGQYRSLEDGTTGFPMSSFIVKWSLIFLVILIPLILLPILFLFTRQRTEEGNAISAHKSGTGDIVAEDDVQFGDVNAMRNLPRPTSLLPTIRNRDPFLYDRANVRSSERSLRGLIKMDLENEEPFYYLDPDVSFINIENSQLYHLPSGLVFNPIHEFIFHPEERLNVQILTSATCEPQPNQVYNPETNKLYERCLALGYNPQLDHFFLPRQPTIPDNATSVVAIRRLEPEELPPLIDRIQYIDKINSGSPTASKIQVKSKVKSKTAVQNPLLLTKNDFSKLQPSNKKRTPRS